MEDNSDNPQSFDLRDIGTEANPEQGFISAMQMPRQTTGYRSKTIWQCEQLEDADVIIINPDNDKDLRPKIGKAHAVISAGTSFTIAAVNQMGRMEPVYRIPSGHTNAVVREYFTQVLTQQQYLLPWLNTDWISELTLLESQKKLLAQHHTCPELESNWQSIFSKISGRITVSHSDNTIDVGGYSRALKVTDQSIKDSRGWYDRGWRAVRPTTYPVLIKNPDVDGDENRMFGAKNGITACGDENGMTMFAVGVPSRGDLYLARPIAMGLQEEFSREYQRITGAS